MKSQSVLILAVFILVQNFVHTNHNIYILFHVFFPLFMDRLYSATLTSILVYYLYPVGRYIQSIVFKQQVMSGTEATF